VEYKASSMHTPKHQNNYVCVKVNVFLQYVVIIKSIAIILHNVIAYIQWVKWINVLTAYVMHCSYISLQSNPQIHHSNCCMLVYFPSILMVIVRLMGIL